LKHVDHGNHDQRSGAKGPRAVAALVPENGRSQLLVAANHGVEWWQESEDENEWKLKQRAVDPSLGSPFFSLAVDAGFARKNIYTFCIIIIFAGKALHTSVATFNFAYNMYNVYIYILYIFSYTYRIAK